MQYKCDTASREHNIASNRCVTSVHILIYVIHRYTVHRAVLSVMLCVVSSYALSIASCCVGFYLRGGGHRISKCVQNAPIKDCILCLVSEKITSLSTGVVNNYGHCLLTMNSLYQNDLSAMFSKKER